MSTDNTFAVRMAIDTPIEIKSLLHLDAILSLVMARRGGKADNLPLAMSHGVWHASAALLETGLFGAVRTDVPRIKSLIYDQSWTGLLGKRPAQKCIISEMSPYRPQLQWHARMDGVLAVWFVCEGDQSAVVNLLEDIEYLGALHTVGYGRRMSDVEVFPVSVPSPGGLVLADGRPARAVPVRIWEELSLPRHPAEIISKQTWRPDYRDGRTEICVSPSQYDLTGVRSEIAGMFGMHVGLG